jgi:hypothetical protein
MNNRVKFVWNTLLVYMLLSVSSVLAGSKAANKQSYQVSTALTGIFSILLGFMFTFFGRYLYKTVLFLSGFLFGTVLLFTILTNVEPYDENGHSQWHESRTTIYFVSCLVSGLVFGCIVRFAWKFGLFLLGGFAGFTFAAFVCSWQSGLIIQNDLARTSFLLTVALIGGIVVLFFDNVAIVCATSLVGSYVLCLGVDCFSNTGFRQSVYSILNGKQELYQIKNPDTYALLGSMLFIAAMGVLVQLRVTSKNVREVGK